MKLLISVLWLLLAVSGAEMVYGIVKKSKFLVIIGLVVAVMCALGLYLGILGADAIYITGEGQLV